MIIGRPLKEEGMSVRECKRFLTEHFSLAHRPHITLLGIGMGSQKLLTVQGKNSLDQADLLIGARRMVNSVNVRDRMCSWNTEARRSGIILMHTRSMTIL